MNNQVVAGAMIMTRDVNLPDANWKSLIIETAINDLLTNYLLSFILPLFIVTPTRLPFVSGSPQDFLCIIDYFPKREIETDIQEQFRNHKKVSCTFPVPRLPRMRGRLRMPGKSQGEWRSSNDLLRAGIPRILQYRDERTLGIDKICAEFKAYIASFMPNLVPQVAKVIKKAQPLGYITSYSL